MLALAQCLFLKSCYFKNLMQAFSPCISEISHSPNKDVSGGPETYLPIGMALGDLFYMGHTGLGEASFSKSDHGKCIQLVLVMHFAPY